MCNPFAGKRPWSLNNLSEISIIVLVGNAITSLLFGYVLHLVHYHK